MIFTELYQGQGLGNQLFVYVATRALAKKLGQPFGIKHPERFKAPRLFDIDFGEQVPDDIEYVQHNEYWHGQHAPINDNLKYLVMTDKSVFNYTNQQNVKLEGGWQSEGYFHEDLENIPEWLKVKEEYDHNDTNDDNLCVINVRGGECRNSHVFPPRSYWDDAIQKMVEFNPNMKFVVVTDDPDGAKQVLPEFECYHRDIETERQNPQDSFVGYWDYVALKNCQHIICCATTFACFPLYTNKNLKKCIAPKYSFCAFHSDGYWCRGSSIFSYVTEYMDTSGNLFTPEQCWKEWKEYYTSRNIFTQEELDNIYEWGNV